MELLISTMLWVLCTAVNCSSFVYSRHIWRKRCGTWYGVGGWHLLIISEVVATALFILVLITKFR